MSLSKAKENPKTWIQSFNENGSPKEAYYYEAHNGTEHFKTVYYHYGYNCWYIKSEKTDGMVCELPKWIGFDLPATPQTLAKAFPTHF